MSTGDCFIEVKYGTMVFDSALLIITRHIEPMKLALACGVACEQAPSWRQAQQKFGAKRRASGACTHLPKSQLPPTRRTACQLSSFNQSARAESQNPQQTKNDTHEILVFACLFSRKNYLWLKSRDTKPRTITAKLRSSEGHVKE